MTLPFMSRTLAPTSDEEPASPVVNSVAGSVYTGPCSHDQTVMSPCLIEPAKLTYLSVDEYVTS